MLAFDETEHVQASFIHSINILDGITTIQKINNHTKQSLESISDDTVLQNFQKIDDIVSDLQTLLKQTKNTQTNVSSKSNTPMIDVSLLDVLNHSLPRKVPSKITIHIPEKDITIKGLHYRLIVLFSNLIENSIHVVNNRGSVFISTFESKTHVTIHVEDTSPGISKKVMSKLFASLVTSKPRGSGLGMAMAKSIVDQHGGEISVTNNPTIFTIKFPRLD